MTRVGLVSDTHGLLEPRLLRLFRGCELILHAGDVVRRPQLDELARIAPVRAVRGNNDVGRAFADLPDLDLLELEGRRAVLVHRIGGRARLLPEVRRAVARHRATLLVYGHSHRPFAGVEGGLLFVNPGSAGPRRFALPRAAGVLELHRGEGEVRLHDLSTDDLPPLGPPVPLPRLPGPPRED